MNPAAIRYASVDGDISLLALALKLFLVGLIGYRMKKA
jgi:hypothetical protein